MTRPGQAGERAPGLGRALEFMQVMWSLDHGLGRASRAMEALHGVTGPQRLVVRMVGRTPGISAGQLAAHLHLHPSTLTSILARLVERGLLRRRADPADTRRALFWLTGRGRRVDDLRSGTIEERVERALASLPRRDLEAARRVLASLARQVSAPLRRAPRARRHR